MYSSEDLERFLLSVSDRVLAPWQVPPVVLFEKQGSLQHFSKKVQGYQRAHRGSEG